MNSGSATSLIAVCRAGEDEQPSSSFHFDPTSQTFCLHGTLEPTDQSEAIRFVRQSRNLVLRSEGGMGRVFAEIALNAEGIESVVVDQYCLSSCANFLFILGERKFVPEGSFVAFHNAPTVDRAMNEIGAYNGVRMENPSWTEAQIFESETYRSRLELSLVKSGDLTRAQEILYLREGVSPNFYKDLNKVDYGMVLGTQPGWSPSAQVLFECYGVKGITVYWQPEEEVLNATAREHFSNIRLFRLPRNWHGNCHIEAPDLQARELPYRLR
jgi:hypothetical protein